MLLWSFALSFLNSIKVFVVCFFMVKGMMTFFTCILQSSFHQDVVCFLVGLIMLIEMAFLAAKQIIVSNSFIISSILVGSIS